MTLGRLVAGTASHAAASSKLRFEGAISTGLDNQWAVRIGAGLSIVIVEVSKVYYGNEVWEKKDL